MPNPGDKVQITSKKTSEHGILKSTEEGILVPSFDQKVVLLKLDNGYNIGFDKKDILSIKVLEKGKKQQAVSVTVGKKKDLPTIAVLHTGGTIASKVDYRTGGVATEFSAQQLVSLFPELTEIANIESELIAQMWSDDLRFAHFALIAKAIERHIMKGVKGIIIGIGTDNLAVASAALAFIVEQTPVPILLVGAQRSSDRGSSDAGMNLISAATFISQTDFSGVAICMHESSSDQYCAILPACKTYKLHSSRRDAFRPVNAELMARVHYAGRGVSMIAMDYPKRGKPLILKPKMEEKVGLLKIHINMFPEQFSFFKGYKGLVLEGTGLGHTPGQVPNPECAIHKKIYPAIKQVIDSGCVVVMTTQCLFGGVNMNVYDKGRDLLALGVIPGKDMLGNTALVKLSWLLGNYKKEDAQKLMGENLRGEINESLGYEKEWV